MQTKLYVGNLSYNAGEEELKSLFAKYGTVQNIEIIKDRYTGQSKGFAFVEMSTSEEAQKALELNGTPFLERNLNISEARPQENRGDARRGGGGYSGQKRGGFGGGRGRDRDRSW